MIHIKNLILISIIWGGSSLPAGAGTKYVPTSIEQRLQFALAESDFKSLNQMEVTRNPADEFAPEFTSQGERKSPSRALLLSLLVPGAGQFYTESKTKAGIFVGAEASLWAGFVAFRMVGGWKKGDYQNYASAHAGIDPTGKNGEFYERLTYYDNRDEYNQLTRLFNGPAAPIYPETEYWNWEWDNPQSRASYRDLRNQSKTAFRRSLYMVGLAGLNRVLSALDAFRDAKKFNRKKAFESEPVSFHPQITPFGPHRKIGLVVNKSFF